MRGRATRRSVNLDDLLRWPAILTQTVYTPGEVERFLAKVDIRGDGECWPWTGAVTTQGYGRLGIKRGKPGQATAHRVSLVLATGALVAGPCVCHHCDNPPCCNPRCLFAGSYADNSADMMRKGRNVPGRARPHRWGIEPEQVAPLRVRFANGWTISSLMLAYDATSDDVRDILRGRAFADLGGPTFESLRRSDIARLRRAA